MTDYMDYAHEKRVEKFLKSVCVPSEYLNYDNVSEYSNAKQLLKTDLLNPYDRRSLNRFTRHWVVTRGKVKQARLDDIRRRLKHYNQKQTRQKNNANQKELRLARQRKKLLDKFKQT